MEKLRQEFLAQAIETVKGLLTETRSDEGKNLSPDFQFHLFRRLHTIKGTAQTFDFKTSGALVHEIENLLEALRENKIILRAEIYSTLESGLTLLRQTLENEQQGSPNPFPQDYVNRLRTLIPDAPPAHLGNGDVPHEIPENLLMQLSPKEKTELSSAISNGSSFFLIDVGFDLSDFDEKFPALRSALSVAGKIIATGSNPDVDAARQIGFRTFFVGQVGEAEISRLIKPFGAVVSFQVSSSGLYSNDLRGVLLQIAAAAKQSARSLRKQVNCETAYDAIKLAPAQLKTVYEILLHLVRNAVDHGIESPADRAAAQKPPAGELVISALSDRGRLALRVLDDGRGIDQQKIIETAKKKGLLMDGVVLSDTDALHLIFAPGFSSRETVSELSGRGIGLDIVKDAVNLAKGTIEVETVRGKGTMFEVYLPFTDGIARSDDFFAF